MSRYNRFEVDGRGRAFVNGVEVDNIRKIKTQVEEFGVNVVELTFEADEVATSATRKPKFGCMDFGRAIEALKRGRKIAHEGWNGEGMWLRLVIPETADIDTGYDNLPYIEMKTADNKLVPWLASQTDVLAEDWKIVE